MPHRTDDLDRVRTAHSRSLDGEKADRNWQYAQTIERTDRIAAENRPQEPDSPERTAAIIAAVERSRVIPLVLATTACAEHGADVGEACFHRAVTGICGSRLAVSNLRRWGAT